MNRRLALITAFMVAFVASADAQWLKQPTRGLPRTRDGKPNLTAKTPRVDGHPDLSGIWGLDPQGYGFNIAADLSRDDVLPWARALFDQRSLEYAKDWPAVRCLPQPGPLTTFGMFKVLQTRDVITVLTEDGRYRQIHTDGRALPKDPQPTWMGYSIGHWEGDTFVVETSGFNDRTWLDMGGHPHTEALRIVERYRRTDVGHLKVQMTFEDEKTFARPFTVSLEASLVPDTEMLEYVCNENEKDLARFVVTDAERAAAPSVPADVLASYAGSYEVAGPFGPPMKFVVTVKDGRLLFQPPSGAPYEGIPLSETRFSTGGTHVDFFTTADRAVSHFIIYTVEGEMKGTRR